MFENHFGTRPERPPVINLLIILLMVGLGFIIVGPIIGFFLALPFYDGGMIELADAIQNPLDNPDIKIPLYIVQGCATFVGLIVAPAVYLKGRQKSVGDFFSWNGVGVAPVFITVAAVIIFMAVNSVFIEWNAEINFPDFAREFEEWARAQEDIANPILPVRVDDVGFASQDVSIEIQRHQVRIQAVGDVLDQADRQSDEYSVVVHRVVESAALQQVGASEDEIANAAVAEAERPS